MKIAFLHLQPIRVILLPIIMLIGACTSQPTSERIVPSNTPAPRMTIVDSATLPPTRTPGAFPTVTPNFLCDGAPESNLIIMERARVTQTDDEETLNLRSGPGTNYLVLARIDQLETFFVVDGPQCSGGYTWFQVNYKGRVGWIAEGDEDQYFAEPYLTG